MTTEPSPILELSPEAAARSARAAHWTLAGARALGLAGRGALFAWGAWSVLKPGGEGHALAWELQWGWHWGALLVSLAAAGVVGLAAAGVGWVETLLGRVLEDSEAQSILAVSRGESAARQDALAELLRGARWLSRLMRQWLALAAVLEALQILRPERMNGATFWLLVLAVLGWQLFRWCLGSVVGD